MRCVDGDGNNGGADSHIAEQRRECKVSEVAEKDEQKEEGEQKQRPIHLRRVRHHVHHGAGDELQVHATHTERGRHDAAVGDHLSCVHAVQGERREGETGKLGVGESVGQLGCRQGEQRRLGGGHVLHRRAQRNECRCCALGLRVHLVSRGWCGKASPLPLEREQVQHLALAAGQQVHGVRAEGPERNGCEEAGHQAAVLEGAWKRKRARSDGTLDERNGGLDRSAGSPAPAPTAVHGELTIRLGEMVVSAWVAKAGEVVAGHEAREEGIQSSLVAPMRLSERGD
mmetsp:Transcript_28575/g.92698  ORF Transcript_28575/g.92698 Transcript_28575/m.92698 type:complete len:285 (+) Transcript_28575:781-1635(+)